MRQVVLDTETTGLEAAAGHRIIEIGCVELVDRRRGRHLQFYLNPEREIDAAAAEVHGITLDALRDKPKFREIADRLLEFVQGAELVIHNAAFDVGFLDRELELAGRAERIGALCSVLDTLTRARELHPGQKNSLDALCKRYGVDASQRDLHGALLDAELLADVYLAMTGGQAALSLDAEPAISGEAGAAVARLLDRQGLALVIRAADAEEIAAHEARLARLREAAGGRCIWDLEPAAP